ncbi:MAG: sulfite exporter TauE/SafE family protein [Phycisphaeraceae bacterium]|nr:sulfite exporter TauE/SafE family protein [Phycisphaeraceae bacterium]
MMDPSLSLLYLPSALALGSLHALEPGHAKTLTAAYLIGIKGTKRDAVLLGLSVAATHSIVVIAIAALALWIGQEAFADQAGRWLQIGSGLLVILLGSWMLWRRWPRHAPAHPHAPEPVPFQGRWAAGNLAIIDTPDGERLQCMLASPVPGLSATIRISRDNGPDETLVLAENSQQPGVFTSTAAPAEPHEFAAHLELAKGGQREAIGFAMHEPEHHHDHGHDHVDLDEQAHLRAHAATMPDYVRQGLRPSAGQIMAFGAAGGMIPCPASITVMLLALSIGKTGWGLLMVLGFSVGLALTLVGVGVLIVLSLGRIGKSERFAWISTHAPLVSAAVVILSGLGALLVVH